MSSSPPPLPRLMKRTMLCFSLQLPRIILLLHAPWVAVADYESTWDPLVWLQDLGWRGRGLVSRFKQGLALEDQDAHDGLSLFVKKKTYHRNLCRRGTWKLAKQILEPPPPNGVCTAAHRRQPRAPTKSQASEDEPKVVPAV